MNHLIAQHRKTSRAASLALRATLLGGLMAVGTSANALITFEFDFGTDDGVGFWEAGVGASRQTAINTAATSFAAMFATHFSNTATIKLEATATNTGGSTLASAGSYLSHNGSPGFTANDIVRIKAQGGADANGAAADGLVNINFGHAWQLDIDATVGGGQFDFYGVAYHEFTHALGFSSLIKQDGTSELASRGLPNTWGAFDQFVVDKNAVAMITPGTFAINPDWSSTSIGGTSPGAGLFFNGANAVTANSGNLVGLYSPTSFQNGSSVSHLDTNNSLAYGGMMMLHAVGFGPAARNYSAVEVGMMLDLGYTAVVAVPEPSTYALMLAGLGMVGWLARRRKSV